MFEQVAINNASELNFNEDEAPAIRACRWLLHTKEEGSLKDRGGVSLHFYLDVLFFFISFAWGEQHVFSVQTYTFNEKGAAVEHPWEIPL